MTHRTIFILALLVSITFSCKTKKIAAKVAAPDPVEKPMGDTELDKMKKELPDEEIERTENGIKFTFSSEILFPTNSSYLSESAKSRLEDVAKILKAKEGNRKIQIDGHSDATGTPEYNIWLSEKRAVSVKTFLVAQGIDEKRIQTSGKGANLPVATNKTKEGRLKNRRVEVTLLK